MALALSSAMVEAALEASPNAGLAVTGGRSTSPGAVPIFEATLEPPSLLPAGTTARCMLSKGHRAEVAVPVARVLFRVYFKRFAEWRVRTLGRIRANRFTTATESPQRRDYRAPRWFPQNVEAVPCISRAAPFRFFSVVRSLS
jgi:hypothetical protein